MSALVLAYAGAAVIAIASASFGVGIARIIWADDLKHAQHIDEIRSRTEAYQKSTIESLQRQIDILKR